MAPLLHSTHVSDIGLYRHEEQFYGHHMLSHVGQIGTGRMCSNSTPGTCLSIASISVDTIYDHVVFWRDLCMSVHLNTGPLGQRSVQRTRSRIYILCASAHTNGHTKRRVRKAGLHSRASKAHAHTRNNNNIFGLNSRSSPRACLRAARAVNSVYIFLVCIIDCI